MTSDPKVLRLQAEWLQSWAREHMKSNTEEVFQTGENAYNMLWICDVVASSLIEKIDGPAPPTQIG